MESIRERLGRWGSDLTVKGEMAWRRPELLRAAECLLRFLLAVGLSRAEVFGGFTPFGVAVVAVSGAGITGFVAFLGVVLGAYLGGDFLFGLKYISMAVLVYAANFVLHDLKFYSKTWFRPAIAAAMAAAVGSIYALDAGWTINATVFFVTETVLVGGAAYFFQIALDSWRNPEVNYEAGLKRTVSVLLLLGTCLIALVHWTLPAEISVGRLLAVFLVMCTAYKCGAGSGASAGAALGIAMDAGLEGTPFFSMAYAFSGLLSGLFGRHGKLLFLVSFVLANGITVLWNLDVDAPIAALYEVFIVSMAFLLLPSGVIGKFAIDLTEPMVDYTGDRARSRIRGRLGRLGAAFGTLYESLAIPQVHYANDNDIATVFDRAAEVCCRSCARSATCWQTEYETTLNAMNNATGPMMERGQLQEADFPEHFREVCKHLERYIDLVNGELKALLLRRQFSARLRELRGTMVTQYADMGQILAELSAEMAHEPRREPLQERKLRRYLQSIDLEAQTAVFRDRRGRLHAEMTGVNLRPLARDQDGLEKLSAVLGVRLTRKESPVGRAHMAVMEAEPFAAAVGIASVRRRGQAVSGDRGTYFKTEDGTLWVILTDGMGTGPEAARESQHVSIILERFLQAGIGPEAALKLLEGALSARPGDEPGFASVDLFGLSLFTGEMQLHKYGAAPTYLKRGNQVRAIHSARLAAGLTPGGRDLGGGTDQTVRQLAPGSFVVLVTDGVLMDEDDMWFTEKIAGYAGSEAKELARELLEAAIARTGHEDDKTVLAVWLEERG
ncbi:MAG: SpoIIE family protein phosphatase [Oscillospiraceae bacterium]|nr:SpoIIE family protein phosphatase [Oscillospiraceae bacterium]